jgi:hypothetical protein
MATDAIEQLKTKFEQLNTQQRIMKAVNQYFRKHSTCVGCPEITEEQAKDLDAKYANRVHARETAPYFSYEIDKNYEKLKMARERLEQHCALEEMPTQEIPFTGGRIIVDAEENRVKIEFYAQLSDELIGALKSLGYKWVRDNQHWQRQRTEAALFAARFICGAAI